MGVNPAFSTTRFAGGVSTTTCVQPGLVRGPVWRIPPRTSRALLPPSTSAGRPSYRIIAPSGSSVEVGDRGALSPGAWFDPFEVQLRVHRGGPRSFGQTTPAGPRTGVQEVVAAAAVGARSVAGGERDGLVEEEQRGPSAGRHRIALHALPVEHAADPRLRPPARACRAAGRDRAGSRDCPSADRGRARPRSPGSATPCSATARRIILPAVTDSSLAQCLSVTNRQVVVGVAVIRDGTGAGRAPRPATGRRLGVPRRQGRARRERPGGRCARTPRGTRPGGADRASRSAPSNRSASAYLLRVYAAELVAGEPGAARARARSAGSVPANWTRWTGLTPTGRSCRRLRE